MLHQFAQARLQALVPSVPDVSQYTALVLNSTVSLHNVLVAFDLSGAIVELVDSLSGVSWASPTNPIGKFVYQVC